MKEKRYTGAKRPRSWIAWIVVFALLQSWLNVLIMLIFKRATIYLAWIQFIVISCICAFFTAVAIIEMDEVFIIGIAGLGIFLILQGIYIRYLGGETAQNYIKS